MKTSAQLKTYEMIVTQIKILIARRKVIRILFRTRLFNRNNHLPKNKTLKISMMNKVLVPNKEYKMVAQEIDNLVLKYVVNLIWIIVSHI